MAYIKLDRKAYEFNLDLIASKIRSYEKIICVFKDNAYGHGAKDLAPIARAKGVNFIAVKNEYEATQLQDIFDNILILSHIPNFNENDKFIYALNDKRDIKKIKTNTKIHLVVDTNMHRNGISFYEIEEVLNQIKNHQLKLCGVMMHFAGSDEFDGSYYVQKQNFKFVKEKVKKILGEESKKIIFHSHNSEALFRSSKLDDDEYCRVGLVQFGYAYFNQNLRKVLSLWANKISQRTLQPYQSLGYGGAYVAKNTINIATYDLGYGDGLFRYNGKKDLILPNGKKILGKMSMDNFSCEDCGDEICVIKDANEMARFFNTINYEILVKLSPFLERIVV
ncbi:alanine racemase [Campylobacter insulaenigrae]|uniref:Alanine racemase n=1 Tax=Campylobacter insulaenigrae NCTC 12927 TaxID=1031564 RepID=A0A0A8H1V0_9BACT|nr:alanine racemase [Campylobacter insulaenigrae]AJC88056.1 alanine racemase [Campylobacter insulaenigrae NCTC 12927]MCR6591597.1 alanine racemase [Campylobacter insulaenigrae]MCR6593491.1 alanine racemase [Campylobacter insulaenigrae]VEH94702.1 alanine racemase [Campylobacter insulaenigrae]VEJ54657.1 alanine racemase [Campylobacter insulaenigrae]